MNKHLRNAKLHPLEQGWVELISMYEPYHWYGTLTFQEQIHPDIAKKRFSRFIRKINEELYGRRYREKNLAVPWVHVIEYQKRNVVHFHFLIGGDVWKLERLKYKYLWEKNFMPQEEETINGFARIDEYDPGLGAKFYLTKAIRFRSEIDFHFPKKPKGQLVFPEVIRTLT